MAGSQAQSPATDVTVEESEFGSTSDSTTAFQSSALSILSKLRAPSAAEISQKRKVRSNAPPHTDHVCVSNHFLADITA